MITLAQLQDPSEQPGAMHVELAGYLVWLRTATPADLARLGPL